jgi:hypothetical protein
MFKFKGGSLIANDRRTIDWFAAGNQGKFPHYLMT